MDDTQNEQPTADALTEYGLALRDRNDLDTAKAALLRAIGTDHDHADAHLGLAEVLLANGEYEPGFIEYQWRMRSNAGRQIKLPDMTSAPWNGMKLSGAKLLLISDQGYGDGIQFIRYVPLIKKLGLVQDIAVACGRELQPVFAQVEGVDECHSNWTDVPPHAAHALLSDLPYLLRTTFDTVPWDAAYVHHTGTDKTFSRFLRPVRRIGIAWSGRPTPGNDRMSSRSMSLHNLRPLVRFSHRELVSLQTPVSAEDKWLLRSWGVKDLGSSFDTFADTVAALDTIDAVVTIDTSVAHLAGAMGIPVMLMVPFSADWRWCHPKRRHQTPWYPHTKVFRQTEAGDWGSVIEPIRAWFA